MRRKTLAAVAALGAVTLWSGTVVAQQAGRPRGADPASKLQAEIGLSDEQAAAIRELRLQERKAADHPRRADMRMAQLELDQLLAAPTLDEAAVAARREDARRAGVGGGSGSGREPDRDSARRLGGAVPEDAGAEGADALGARVARRRGWRHAARFGSGRARRLAVRRARPRTTRNDERRDRAAARPRVERRPDERGDARAGGRAGCDRGLPPRRARGVRRLVARYQRPIYRLCYRYVNNHEDANDLAQEAFLKAWRAIASFRGRQRLLDVALPDRGERVPQPPRAAPRR